jgi:hypothetical protein
MSGMKKMLAEQQRQVRYFLNPLKRVAILLPVCVIVLAGCATTGVPTLKPPACPAWNDEAIDQLEVVLTSEMEIKDLEYHIAEQLRHCEALDAWLEDEDC